MFRTPLDGTHKQCSHTIDNPLCLNCAGIGDLVCLGRGNPKLTRRAHSYSTKSAVVVRFSNTRKRYERQGILVKPAALKKVESEL